MNYLIILYYKRNILKYVQIELDNILYLSNFIKYNNNELYFIITNDTPSINENDYHIIKKYIEIEFDMDIFIKCYINPKYYLLDNL